MHPDEEAKQLDAVVRDDILALSPMKLLNDLNVRGTEACGGGPIAAVMHASMLLGADTSHILHQCTSGDVTGDTDKVVGYLSAAFVRTNTADVEASSPDE